MIRKIIKIDEEKCNGCGACALACHEGAIEMIDGKARLTREDYCDGLGDCLPACPTGAITFEEREAPAYDEAAVLLSKKYKEAEVLLPKKCKGAEVLLPKKCKGAEVLLSKNCNEAAEHIVQNETQQKQPCDCPGVNQLMQWPVQIKLVPVNAPYFENANLLIAADCSAYAYGNFHNEFMRNHVTLIGCPKLDQVDYAEKLTAIISNNNIKSVTVTRMEVPCCGGIENAVKRALQASGKFIPWRIVTISTDGKIY